ncbi:hypothetical protein BX600DRAFT_442624 [Xylariales sp. PMI_506]|nr:hypothetical protein BX600DRAFT_442624 [Xylariales sp. PMI_506]
MSQRRFHSKSRHGCLQCKKSRKKCDEGRPSCGRCERIGTDCSLATEEGQWTFVPSKRIEPTEAQARRCQFSVTMSSAGLSTGSVKHNNPRVRTGGTQNATEARVSALSMRLPMTMPEVTGAERERLRLMNHYTLTVSKSISSVFTPYNNDIWGDWVGHMAIENDFLLHSVLSISAVHLALYGIDPQQQSIAASRHHGAGISLVRPHIGNLKEDIFDAVVTYTCLLTLYFFGSKLTTDIDADPLHGLLQAMTLIRGCSAVVTSDIEARRRSRWPKLFMQEIPNLPERLPEEIEVMLALLQGRAALTASKEALEGTYLPSIEALRINIAVALTLRFSLKSLGSFPILAPASFWTLAQNETPLALAILANYCIILHWLRGSIWIQGWGKRGLEAIQRTLPEEWQECIAWAVAETESLGTDQGIAKVAMICYPDCVDDSKIMHLKRDARATT